MLTRLLQSERYWECLLQIVKVMEPCLYILRLADRQSPAMDLLYFYVRKMDGIVERLKESLNTIEDRFNSEDGNTFHSKMMNYFMMAKETSNLESFFNIPEHQDEDLDDDEVSLEDDELEDDLSSASDVDDDDSHDNENKCGSVLERVWKKRSKALRTDIAIAGWMCSPNSEVMNDCQKNHNGDHRTAVTRLLRRWYIHQVI